MLLASLIIMFVVSGLLMVASVFLKKKDALYFLINALTIIAIIITEILCANYFNNFNGYSIILIIACVPLFLILFDFKQKQTLAPNESKTENVEMNQENAKEKKKKINFSQELSESSGRIFEGLAFLISAFLIAFAGLYLGKVSYFGFLMCLPFALAGICISYLKSPKINKFDLIANILTYLAVGFLFGQILAVLIYSQTISSILYSLGALLFSTYAITSICTKERRINIILYASLILFSISILFL